MKKTIILAAIILLIISLIRPLMIWDEYVYILNGQYFAGEKLYFEEIRPPVLPLIISIFYFLKLEFLAGILPILSLISLSIILFFFSKQFLKERAIYSVLLLFSFPVILLYGTRLLTDVPSTALFTLSLFLMNKYSHNNKSIFLFLSFFFAAITTLIRYPLGLIYPTLIILYFVFNKKIEWMKLLLSQLFFIIPIVCWINYIGIEAIYNAIIWSGLPSEELYFLYNIQYILGFTIFLTPFIFKYKYEKKDLWFLIPLIVLLVFFQIFRHKEYRFMIQVTPFLSILLIKSLAKIKEKILTIILLTFFVITLILVYYSVNQYETSCGGNSVMTEFREYFLDKNGTILTNFVPLCSYHLNRSCFVLSYLPEWLPGRIIDLNVSFIAVSNIYTHPPYSSNLSYFSNYSMNKLINGSCEQIFIYSVPR